MPNSSKLACIDLEGVLIPELWPRIAALTGIRALATTTREVSDYDALMCQRIALLREQGVTLSAVQHLIETVQPFPDSTAFLHTLAAKGYEVILISDCFQELVAPMLRSLGNPAIACHRLLTDCEGFISGCDYFPRRGKETHVEHALAKGLHVVAVGDAFNDVAMLRQASQGFLINPSQATLEAVPDVRAVRSLGEILNAVI
ncbi:bifunctional phosphoserine phosphatase/homoserine phosphotransferase ThrH [Pseudomonas alabamensis]|uniref:bifunctional phosphoserine phosphatase/homoserine phosphotransferase ThrH n=1 Tax=Pseudomonas alabamensis TaxID=3064349 RepID=UPI003F64FBAA